MGYPRHYMQEQMLKNDKEKNLLVIMKKFSSTKEKNKQRHEKFEETKEAYGNSTAGERF